jgi:general secretion pathway protein G
VKGFTYIELIVTLAIVSALSALVTPVAQTQVKRAKEAELRVALRQVREAIDTYKRAVDAGRVERKLDETGYPRRLEELVEGVVDVRDPDRKKIFFLRQIPRDPFHGDTTGVASATWGKRSYASEANEPKEGKDIYDIYSLSGAIGLNGVPYRRW